MSFASMYDDFSALPRRIMIARGSSAFDIDSQSDDVLYLSCSIEPWKKNLSRYYAHVFLSSDGMKVEVSKALLHAGASYAVMEGLIVCLSLPWQGIQVYFAFKAWYAAAELVSLPVVANRRSILVTFQGRFHDRYYDGPICHADPNGNILSYIPPAVACTLEIPMLLKLEDVRNSSHLFAKLAGLDVKAHNLRRSLAKGIQQSLATGLSETCMVSIDTFNLKAAALLVGLRVALKDVVLCTILDGANEQLPVWRRLCQHLNIFFDKNASGLYPSATIGLSQFSDLIPDAALLEIVQSLNHYGFVIPQRLIATHLGSRVSCGHN